MGHHTEFFPGGQRFSPGTSQRRVEHARDWFVRVRTGSPSHRADRGRAERGVTSRGLARGAAAPRSGGAGHTADRPVSDPATHRARCWCSAECHVTEWPRSSNGCTRTIASGCGTAALVRRRGGSSFPPLAPYGGHPCLLRPATTHGANSSRSRCAPVPRHQARPRVARRSDRGDRTGQSAPGVP